MITDEYGSRYYMDLKEAKEEGYSPVKASSVLCFYQLRGRTDPEILKAVKQEAKNLQEQWSEYLSRDVAISLVRKRHGLYKKEYSLDMVKDNIEPIPGLLFCVHDKSDGRYMVREFREYPLDNLFFYRKTLTFSGEDVAIENLRRYVDDEIIYILFTQAQVGEVTNMLIRLFKSKYTGEGKVPYPIYIQLLYESLRYEDYKSYSSSLTGYKTCCKQFEYTIKRLWDDAYKSNHKITN